MISGYSNGVVGNVVRGWAKADDDNAALPVSLLVDGIVAETKIANLHREELGELGYVSRRHGFEFRLPDRYYDGVPHRVSVNVFGTSIKLPETENASVTFCLGCSETDRALFKHRVAALTSGSVRMEGAGHRGGGPIALYACFSPNGQMSYSQRRMLEALAAAGYRTIVCQSTVYNHESFAAAAGPLCSDILFRSNFGRDFASWCILLHEYMVVMEDADHILFVNDSNLGPFDSMGTVFDDYGRDPTDFYSVTESWDREYHFQSSFFILSARALRSRAFDVFLHTYPFPDEKDDVISYGEIGASNHLLNSTLTRRALIPYEVAAGIWLDRIHTRIEALLALPEAALAHGAGLSRMVPGSGLQQRGHVDYAVEWLLNTASAVREGRPVNPQHIFWQEIIQDFRVPLLKKELLLSNPSNVPGLSNVGGFLAEHCSPVAPDILAGDVRMLGSRCTPPVRRPTNLLASH